MSPRAANASTPSTVEKMRPHRFAGPSPFDIHEDVENIKSDGQIELKPTAIEGHRSPSKPSSPSKHQSPRKADQETSRLIPLTEDALRENEGLTRAMDLMNGGDSILDLYSGHDGASVAGTAVGYPGMDDTCFSTFSAVPNTDMTLFTQTGQSPARGSSPAKRAREEQYGPAASTPRTAGRSTPTTSRFAAYEECSPSPTPRRPKSSRDADTTNLILDFTEQFNAFSSTSTSHHGRPTPRKFNTQPDLASFAANKRLSPTKGVPSTPSRAHNLANLLDFDLPPAPTPRSIPTITARELESLKSTFLSQISSLRATLSGREAEVNSLKEAVTDAERRVGEAQEEIRNERGVKESLQSEKEEWQARDKERQSVLRDVKEEIVHQQHEHEKLQQRLEASEKKREAAEAKALEAESKIAGMQAAAAAVPATPGADGQSTPSEASNGNSNAAVEAAVEKVARELHGLYRSKHETKVAALKKSYEARWEKKIKDLESRITDLDRENEELKISRDATMTGLAAPPHLQHANGEQAAAAVAQEDDDQRRAEEAEKQKIQLANLTKQIETFRLENSTLQQQLEAERLEMAELVKATEEMMQLSLHSNTANQKEEKPASSHNLNTSRGKAPSSERWKQSSFGAESRIGRMGAVGGARSGMMSSIERMGRRTAD
ncbi:MAG: hypothetical protein Q9218_002622 [Villophora microphyllina]